MNLPFHNLRHHPLQRVVCLDRDRFRRWIRLLTRPLLCSLPLALLILIPGSIFAQPPTRRVLIMTASDPNSSGFTSITQSVTSTVRAKSSGRVEFGYELQATLNDESADPEEDKRTAAYLKQKYEHKPVDLILALAAPRLGLILKNDPELFKGVPKIYYDLETKRDLILPNAGDHVTAVWARVDMTATVDIALQLHPAAKRLVVACGDSSFDQGVMREAQSELRKYEDRIAISYVSNLTLEELRAQVAGLPKDSLVMVLSFTADRNGNRYGGQEAVASLAPTSSVPIYGFTDRQMGLGIVGGNLVDFVSIGNRVGDLTLRILAGEKAEDIPPQIVPGVATFDWRELRRWGISESRLPPGSIVRFKQPTLWEAYKWYIIGLIGAVLVEALLIAWLIYLRVRRSQAEAGQVRLSNRLSEIVSNVPGIVWEVEVDPVTKQRTPTFASDYVKTVLGYTPEEWLATPGFGLQAIEAEDRERAFNESEKVVASGKGGVTQFRWRTKDGRLRWAETYFSPMIDNNEKKVVGLRGVTLDITDRKLAEETARQTEEKDRAILAAIPDLMFLQTRDGVYLDYHAKDSSYLLVPPEAFLGKNMHDVLPADLARQFAHCFARVQETSEPQILEYKLTRGEVDLWFEARMVRSGDNVLSVVRDITQRVFIEQAIKKHEAQLAGIIGSAMDAIITVDEGQRILLFNAAAEKIFGWPASEAIGQSLDEFIPERFRAAHRNHVHTFGDDNITRRRMGERGLSLYGLRRSGEEFPIDASISQLQLNGQTFSTVILRDISERKRAEAALKQSEANYRSIFNTANDAIFVHDLKTGRIYDVNERMCEMYGYTVDQVKQLTVADLSSNQPPYTQNEAFDFIQKAGAGEPQVFEWHAKKSSGELFWVEVGLRQAWLRGENCLLAVVRDITERKRAEAQLAESHRRVKEILESIGDAFYSLDKDLRFTYVNSKTEELWGRRREDLLGKKLLEVFPESIGTPSHDASMRAFEEGRPVNYEAMSPILHRWVEASVYPSAAGLSVYFRDITERKRAVDELRQSEERFAKAFNANPQPMSVTALADGRYLNVNDSFLAVSGYTREEVIGHTSLELGIWGTPKQRVAFVEQLLAKGSIVNTETNFYTKNGEPRFLLSSAERFEIGGQECLLVASSDITERKAAEEALVKAHEELVVAHEEVNRLKNQLEAENIYLQEELQEGQAFGDIVGQSAAIKYVLYKINQVAPIDSTVLITGETGTGKELVARAIHSASLRKDRPLIRVNCAALSPMLIESELFGHEKGAFTGAAALKLGRFEVANGGTLLLDEIGELPFDLQSKLLRVIQDGEFERVGGSKTVKVDVRIIAATNRDLKQEVEKGHFREDLWYRLNVFPITTPPLRDRRDDIPLLTDHFAGRLARKFGKPLTAVSPESMDQLCNYSWPGNVRELANVIERAVINSRGSVLRIREDFLSQDAEALAASVKTLEDMEREYITRVLQDLRWRVDGPHGAARVLGMNPSTLRTRMSKLGIQKPNGRSFSAS